MKSEIFADVVIRTLEARLKTLAYWEHAWQKVSERGPWYSWARYHRSPQAVYASLQLASDHYFNEDMFCLTASEEAEKGIPGHRARDR